jgi:hypothetical protein
VSDKEIVFANFVCALPLLSALAILLRAEGQFVFANFAFPHLPDLDWSLAQTFVYFTRFGQP